MTNVKLIKHILHLGLDHLEIYASFKDESRFEGLDFDNSNQVYLGDITGAKSDIKKYGSCLEDFNKIKIF